jgi:aminoglycoside phosphotransferase (APT) family kinase protein
MSTDGFEHVSRIDAPAIVRAIVASGGPAVQLVKALDGGAVGAWLVRWSDGHLGVLTRFHPDTPGQPNGTFDRAKWFMDAARGAGVPVPRYEAVVPIGDLGVAVLQERIEGRTPGVVTETLIQHVLELADLRRGLLVDTPDADSLMPLFLTSSGPGFCLHDTLRTFNRRTRVLLEAIEATTDPENDHLRGSDVVHFDYHLGNVLVAPDRPDRVVGIVDWGGARPGSSSLDLAILAFDLTWRTPATLQQRVENHLLATSDASEVAKVWAHASLRLLDWSIRHHPQDVDHWATAAGRHLDLRLPRN